MREVRRRRAPFSDRREAGIRLAAAVAEALAAAPVRYPDPVVLGLARGGVLPAAEVAAELAARLDVVVVRKLGHPRRPELGLGAIGESGVLTLNEPLLARLGIGAEALDAIIVRERAELARRAAVYRCGGAPVVLAGATAVVVDDGLATGFSAMAAVQVVRRRGAVRVVLAVPVAAREAMALLRPAVDELICLVVPGAFGSVSQAYRTFDQVPDGAVLAALGR